MKISLKVLLMGVSLTCTLTKVHATSIYDASYDGSGNVTTGGSVTLDDFIVVGIYTGNTAFVYDGTAYARIYNPSVVSGWSVGDIYSGTTITQAIYQNYEEFINPTGATLVSSGNPFSYVSIADLSAIDKATPLAPGPSAGSNYDLNFAPVTFTLTPSAATSVSNSSSTTVTDAGGANILFYKPLATTALAEGQAYTVTGFVQGYFGKGEIVGASFTPYSGPPPTGLNWVGGSGTWNATGGTDWDGGAWDSTKTATFNASPGTVSLGTPVTATGVTFNTGGYTVSGSGANVLTLSGSTAGNVISVANAADIATISATISGNSGLTKSGSGMLALTGTNTFTGPVTITGGVLAVGADTAMGDAANGIVLNTGALKSTAALAVGTGRTLSGTGTIDAASGAITFNGPVDASALTLTANSVVNFAGTSAALTSAALGAGSMLTISAPLTSASRTTFTGDGMVALDGDNSFYGGGISLSRGAGAVGPTVLLGSATALGGNTLYLNAGTLQAAGTFTGGSAIYTSVSFGGNATFTGSDMEFTGNFGFFSNSAKRLTVLNNTTISSSIASTGSTDIGDALIKAGAGKLTLTASNLYTGGTQVLSGTLEVTNTGTLGLGDVLVAAEDAIATVLRLDSNTTISDLSNVFINNGVGVSQIDLNFDNTLFEVVNSLTINGTPVTPGDYSASDLPAYLTGTGNLRVLSAVPEPSVWALLLLSGCGLAAARTRRSRKSVA